MWTSRVGRSARATILLSLIASIASAALSAPPPSNSETVYFEVRERRFEAAGTTQRSLTTKGPRKHYTLVFDEVRWHAFTRPTLRCVSGPCDAGHDSTPESLSVTDFGRKVSANWTAWGEAKTWILSAERRKIVQVSFANREVALEQPFVLEATLEGPAPEIQGVLPSGQGFCFVVGEPTNRPEIELVGSEETGGVRHFTYRFRR